MPPKAKAKADGPKPADKERLAWAEAEVQSLQRLLDIKAHEATEARAAERAWRQRAEAAEARLQQLQADMLDVSADIKRQSEGTREQLERRIQELEVKQQDLQGQLEERDAAVAGLNGIMGQQQSQTTELEALHRQQVQRMQAEFAAMLKDTMEKLRQRLEERHTSKVAALQR